MTAKSSRLVVQIVLWLQSLGAQPHTMHEQRHYIVRGVQDQLQAFSQRWTVLRADVLWRAYWSCWHDSSPSNHRCFQTNNPLFVVLHLWCQSLVDIPENNQDLIIYLVESFKLLL